MTSIELLKKLIKDNKNILDYISNWNENPFKRGVQSTLESRDRSYTALLIEELNNKLEDNKKQL